MFLVSHFVSTVLSKVANVGGWQPDFTLTTGAYLRKNPSDAWMGTTATLMSVAGWGNSHPFKAP
eukprot:3904132-Amphidinium_carterae.1